ncbi:MAG: DUF302 domain-containing protein [Gemmatimonadetes bacterium]|nr:DUF302 domain-containing protein [Gemmatimonadota bacterium]
MTELKLPYGFGATVHAAYDQAVGLTRDALAAQGFGVLTEIDVRATLKNKLDVDFRPYVILGACNPPLAHQALSSELEIGLLLPCNVVVHAGETEGESVVAIMDPQAALSLTGNDSIEPLARDVRSRLDRVLAAVVEQAQREHEMDTEC